MIKVNLSKHCTSFVDQLVASRKYKDASEVVQAGLRLLEQSIAEKEQNLAALRQLAAEGFEAIDQGQGIKLPSGERLAAHIAKLGRKAAKSAGQRKSG